MSKIGIKGLDKAAVLKALYDAARPVRLVNFPYDPRPMSLDEARTILRGTKRFNYIRSRAINVDLSGDEFETDDYDRANGWGTAIRAMNALRR